jgi:hypothetical protein
MSLNTASLLPLFEIGSAVTALGMVCYLTYNLLVGMYSNDKYIQAIKYCFTFAAGYFILKSLIGTKTTISLNEAEITNYQYVTVVGVWAFNFNQVASVAKALTSTLSVSGVAAVTSAIAVIYAAIALHIKLSMNAWRGIPEVFEAFIYGVIAYFSLSHFDVFYNGMTSFLDSIIKALVDYDIYEKYSDGLRPIFKSQEDFMQSLKSFSILGIFTNTLSMILGGITVVLLFLMDIVNLLLYFLQHVGILMLPCFTIAMSFFSGIDPTRPIKLAGAFAFLTLLAKVQIMIMNLLFSSFDNVEAGFQEASNSINLGIAVLGDNLLLIFKVCASIICALLVIIFVSTKILDRVFGIVASSQMMPFLQQTKSVIGRLRS